MTCSVGGCEVVAKSRGLCATHYSRFRRHGSPEVVGKRGRKSRPVMERIRAHLVPSGECLLYNGVRYGPQSGYFQVLVGNVVKLAHRVVWEDAHGPIPAGLEIRHLCDIPTCCEVTHLAMGTRAENEADKNPRRLPEDRRRTIPVAH